MTDRIFDAAYARSPVFTVAVYGTLMSGMHNNALMNGMVSLGTTTVKGYEMYVMSSRYYNSVPFVIKSEDPESEVTVEVFQADGTRSHNTILAGLDMLEDHPDWYTRRTVDVGGDVEAWMYVFEEPMANSYLERGNVMKVETGNWRNPIPEVNEEEVNVDARAA
jgi:gamma-glutamylcyclotransferase (GGCT)/AIG2-like uncharacterized protein YtfP